MRKASANPVHHSRFIRYKSGMTPHEIAAADGVKESTVMESIRTIEISEHLYSVQHLESVQIETVTRNEELASKALGEALKARIVLRDPETNKQVSVEPDHDTRLAAVDRLNAKAAAVFARHKPMPGTTVNVGVGVNVGSSNQGRSYEDRLKAIQGRRKAQLPEGSDAEVLDVTTDAPSQA